MKEVQELRKEEAILLLKNMKICDAFIEQFIKTDEVACFVNFIGTLKWENKRLISIAREIKERVASKVYGIMICFVISGRLYNIFLVGKDSKEWDKAFIQLEEENGCSQVPFIRDGVGIFSRFAFMFGEAEYEIKLKDKIIIS